MHRRRVVVVFDDRNRFCLHVWRYLTREIGFGIGSVPLDESKARSSSGPWLLPGKEIGREGDDVPDRVQMHPSVYWVPAGRGWRRTLERIVARERKSTSPGVPAVFAIVDVFGRGKGYSAVDVIEAVRTDFGRPTIYVVSAYQPEGQIHGFNVLPKTRETLESIRQRVTKVRAPRGSSVLFERRSHVLVTGAGFELAAHRGGVGAPLTATLLSEMRERHGMRPVRRRAGFPVLRAKLLAARADAMRDVMAAAKESNLDRWWDMVLQHLNTAMQSTGGAAGEDALKETDLRDARAEAYEMDLRESFRQSVLKYDWGFMNQSLHAAEIPWVSWLSTNYTGFANRAIDLCALAGAMRPKTMAKEWRNVATPREAQLAARGAPPPWRYLFKLHGDVGHVSTMALAGYDKRSNTPLALQLHGFDEIYMAAERVVVSELRARGLPAVFHIVGHSLRDARLRKLLRWCARYAGVRCLFRVVTPVHSELEEIRRRLVDELGGAKRIDLVEQRADEYLHEVHAAAHAGRGWGTRG